MPKTLELKTDIIKSIKVTKTLVTASNLIRHQGIEASRRTFNSRFHCRISICYLEID